ncbi:MAG: hypothetical protein WD229_16995, partial [Pirellulales bacterium]
CDTGLHGLSRCEQHFYAGQGKRQYIRREMNRKLPPWNDGTPIWNSLTWVAEFQEFRRFPNLI